MKQSQDKLGTMPIGKLLLVMSVPMMISMFVQALYNMVDSMFVAMINEDALTAVSLAFPLQNIMTAIGVGTGVGTSALVSRSLGQKNFERAEKAANVQNFLSACYTVFFAVAGLLFARAFYTTQTDVESIIEYGEDYLSIVCLFSVGAFYGQNLEKLLVATGSSAQSMISQASGAIFNIIFDPILIFGLGPFPEMGVRGAALATVLGQMLAALIAFGMNLRYNHATRFALGKMLPDKETLGSIFSVGIPSMITVGLASVMSFCINQILLAFSTTATAVFGIWLKMQSFGFMPVFGMNNGTIAIYSYNYGAKNYDRVRATQRLALRVGATVTVVGTLLYELLPIPMLKLFSASDYMMSIGVTALRCCAVSLPFGALSVIFASAAQTMGYARYSLFINLCRQIIIQLPVAFILSLSGRLELIWFAPVVSEVASLAVAYTLNRKVMGQLKN